MDNMDMIFQMNNNMNNNNVNNNPARILNMAVSNQLQQQQNFRLHQQRFLAPNHNRKPSEDDLFEMASMLLRPPPQNDEADFLLQPNQIMTMSSMSMMNSNNHHHHHHPNMAPNRISFNSMQTSGSGMSSNTGIVGGGGGGFMSHKTTTMNFGGGSGSMPYACFQPQTSNSMNNMGAAPGPGHDGDGDDDGDLFDDGELDAVLGGGSAVKQKQQRRERPKPQRQPQPRKRQQKQKQHQPAPTTMVNHRRPSSAQNNAFTSANVGGGVVPIMMQVLINTNNTITNSTMMGPTVTPETSEREIHSFSRRAVVDGGNTIGATPKDNTNNTPTPSIIKKTEIFLPEKSLDEMLKSPTTLTTNDKDTYGNNLSEAVNEDNQDEWCLIDFGDDDVEAPGSSSPPSTSCLKRRQSFEEEDESSARGGGDSSFTNQWKKKNRP